MPTPLRKIITLGLLSEKGACKDQRDLFAKHFPDGLSYGAENIPDLVDLIGPLFEWEWAGRKILPKHALEAFKKVSNTAWLEFTKSVAPFLATYNKVLDKARSDYTSDKENLEADDDYFKAIKPARAKYFEEQVPFREVYAKVCALAFLTLFLDSP